MRCAARNCGNWSSVCSSCPIGWAFYTQHVEIYDGAADVQAATDTTLALLAYIAELEAGPTFEQKNAINAEFQRLYNRGMVAGTHGHYETMFTAMHQAYAAALLPKASVREERE